MKNSNLIVNHGKINSYLSIETRIPYYVNKKTKSLF